MQNRGITRNAQCSIVPVLLDCVINEALAASAIWLIRPFLCSFGKRRDRDEKRGAMDGAAPLATGAGTDRLRDIPSNVTEGDAKAIGSSP
jgi:hypothetical protein